jgi:hypothetical protein
MDINKILKLRQFKALDLDVQKEEALIYGYLINTDKHCSNCANLAILLTLFSNVRGLPLTLKTDLTSYKT